MAKRNNQNIASRSRYTTIKPNDLFLLQRRLPLLVLLLQGIRTAILVQVPILKVFFSFWISASSELVVQSTPLSFLSAVSSSFIVVDRHRHYIWKNKSRKKIRSPQPTPPPPPTTTPIQFIRTTNIAPKSTSTLVITTSRSNQCTKISRNAMSSSFGTEPTTSGITAETILERIKELNVVLPPPPKAAANYVPVVQTNGNLLFVSGHLPFLEDGTTLITGRIGDENNNSLEYGYNAARQCGLNLIATLVNYLLNENNTSNTSTQTTANTPTTKVKQIVKLFGIVQSTETFHEQHKVVNGCSDLFVQVFGTPIGVHARSAIGTSNLPLNISVEIEMIVEVVQE